MQNFEYCQFHMAQPLEKNIRVCAEETMRVMKQVINVVWIWENQTGTQPA